MKIKMETTVKRVITLLKMMELKITRKEDTMQSRLGINSRMDVMWCRGSLVGVISLLYGSLRTLRDGHRYVSLYF